MWWLVLLLSTYSWGLLFLLGENIFTLCSCKNSACNVSIALLQYLLIYISEDTFHSSLLNKYYCSAAELSVSLNLLVCSLRFFSLLNILCIGMSSEELSSATNQKRAFAPAKHYLLLLSTTIAQLQILH